VKTQVHALIFRLETWK